MKNELFASMKAQMTPSAAAEAALAARMTRSAPVRVIHWGRYAAAAACAALVLAVYPVWRARTAPAPAPLHSYVTAEEGADLTVLESEMDKTAGISASSSQGDHDIAMSAAELGEEMARLGFAPETAEDFWAAGGRMTWAVWYKYDGGASLEELEAYAQANQAWIDAIVSAYGVPGEDLRYTGEVYSGADVDAADVSVKEEAMAAYETLMASFRAEYGPDAFPDWYGGAYVDRSGLLLVCVTEDADREAAGSKDLYLSIIAMAGGRDAVGFKEVKYSMNHLRALQAAVQALPELGEASPSWSCGVYDGSNKVVLRVERVDDALLSALAVLDPADDAIEVRLAAAVVVEDAAPVIAVGAADTVAEAFDPGEPAPADRDAAPVTDEGEDLIAEEPEE